VIAVRYGVIAVRLVLGGDWRKGDDGLLLAFKLTQAGHVCWLSEAFNVSRSLIRRVCSSRCSVINLVLAASNSCKVVRAIIVTRIIIAHFRPCGLSVSLRLEQLEFVCVLLYLLSLLKHRLPSSVLSEKGSLSNAAQYTSQYLH
jgi:hypothetical protein